MAAIFKGATTVKRKETITYGANGQIDASINYVGEQTALQAIRPAVGSSLSLSGDNGNVVVQSVDFETASTGPYCSMTIKGTNLLAGGAQGAPSDTTYERTFQRIEKDIRTHRAFQAGGQFALTHTEIAQVDDYIQKSWAGPLTANQTELYNRLVRGQTSYPIWVPVARKTAHLTPQPTNTPVGTIQSPPVQCNMPANTAEGKAYIYVLTTDDATKETGKPWRSTQEWMGFDEVDDLIYQNK